MERVAVAADAPSLGDLVAASLQALSAETVTDAAGQVVPVEELLQCVVQTWSELLRDDGLHVRALEGFERVRHGIADALRRGQAAGAVQTVEPESGARVLIGLLHGILLQRVAFGLTDTVGFNEAVRGLLGEAQCPDSSPR
ncbi:TetR family transcriptional regulator C-terminal domain-containing protein [Streptomyces sp. NPDC002092]